MKITERRAGRDSRAVSKEGSQVVGLDSTTSIIGSKNWIYHGIIFCVRTIPNFFTSSSSTTTVEQSVRSAGQSSELKPVLVFYIHVRSV